MDGATRASWRNTTHDWANAVDVGHLREIRRDPAGFAPGGVRHLILEVVAYAADEAEATARAAPEPGGGHCLVTLHADGAVSVADDGRGTDTRRDEAGNPVRKPVMATRDLRFFDHPQAQTLPDGHPRRGMSVVAALSTELLHTNRRHNGAWTQHYAHGVPTTGLVPMTDDGTTGVSGTSATFGTTGMVGTTGTTVRFVPDVSLGPAEALTPAQLRRVGEEWPHLTVVCRDERGH